MDKQIFYDVRRGTLAQFYEAMFELEQGQELVCVNTDKSKTFRLVSVIPLCKNCGFSLVNGKCARCSD